MRVSFLLGILGSSVAACQAFTGTGDLEVRESASTSGAGASSSAASAGGGGQGGTGAAGGGGQGAGMTTSAGGSPAASSGAGGGCATCGSTFESGGDPSEICADNQAYAYKQLRDCLCGTGATGGSCYDSNSGAMSPCGGFCSRVGGGQPPDQACKTCASTSAGCGELLQTCMGF